MGPAPGKTARSGSDGQKIQGRGQNRGLRSRSRPLQGGHSMGIGLQLAVLPGAGCISVAQRSFFEKGSFPKDPSTSQKLRCATEIQICERLAAFRTPLRSPSGHHGVPDLGRMARKYKDVAKIADLGQEVGPPKAATVWGLAPSWRSCRGQAASPSHNAVF